MSDHSADDLLLHLSSQGQVTISGARVPRTPLLPLKPFNEGRGDARIGAKAIVAPPVSPAAPNWEGGPYVRLDDWLSARQAGNAPDGAGLLLVASDDPLRLIGQTDGLALIAIDFAKFNDGRGYSLAALVRTRVGWQGPLRAVGDVLRDQLYLMVSSGFDSFALRKDQDPQACARALADFSERYQQAGDGRGPLWRRQERKAVSGQAKAETP